MNKLLVLLLCFAGPLSVFAQRPGGAEADVAAEPTLEAHTNLLAQESSPYLLQHAHNPVAWYPWGDEAIAKARRENKMIFLSIGYAACHWCHVMERESFEDAEIAQFMNDHFVCVKVDREERPDIDQIYMTAVQMISGGGGWPMSMFLLPDTKPFWGGTYFAARTGDRGQSTGFLSIIKQIDQAWKKEPDVVREQAQRITDAIAKNQVVPENSPPKLETELVSQVAKVLAEQFDPQFGGFGYSANPNQPKFPEPSNLLFLLDRSKRKSVDEVDRTAAADMLRKSLDGMISGAMIDHIGGGFHRYSVDRSWQIPHFEKMLYDNAQLCSIYAEASVQFDSQEYRDVAIGICDFVLRELKADGGAFFSSLDADSEGEEGKFYRWSKQEIADLAKRVDDLDLFVKVFRFDSTPNFETHYFAPDPRDTLTSIAKAQGLNYAQLQQKLSPVRDALFQIRSQRKRPMTDVKVLTAWNGLMISGLADCGRLLQRQDYSDAAAVAAKFILTKLGDDQSRLKRSYAKDEAKLNAYLDDYAFLVSGLIALHKATGDDAWLVKATEVTQRQIQLFWDEPTGGFFFTSKDHPELIVRVKDPVDSAIPAGNSVAAENLRYLANQSDKQEYRLRLKQTLLASEPLIRRSPSAAPRITTVIANFLDTPSR